jgi:hypothetical protein
MRMGWQPPITKRIKGLNYHNYAIGHKCLKKRL